MRNLNKYKIVLGVSILSAILFSSCKDFLNPEQEINITEDKLFDDWYEYRSRHSCLVGRKNRTAYRLGDRVQVQVKSVDYYRQQIDLVTVGGGSIASNEDLED